MWHTFNAKNVAAAPAAPGAYRLYKDARVIFVGMAAGGATLRSELKRHLRGDFGSGTEAASGFDYQEASDALDAYKTYLSLYVSATLRPLEQRNGPVRRRVGMPR
jgi:hypothetical protein